mgnify:CR=1 FL=1
MRDEALGWISIGFCVLLWALCEGWLDWLFLLCSQGLLFGVVIIAGL